MQVSESMVLSKIENQTCIVQNLDVLQIAWEYIYTFPLPLVAKTLALGSANGTAVNTFYLRSNRLANSNDTGVVAPNHDTIYSQAWLDLSQVSTLYLHCAPESVSRACSAIKAFLPSHHVSYLSRPISCPS